MEEILTITQQELESRFGISIPKGEYGVNNDGYKYSITQADGDSAGCVIVGENKLKGKLINSTNSFYRLMDNYLLPASKRGEKITLSIV